MQPSMFDTQPAFDGATFDAKRDGDRLSRLFDRVRALMLDGTWRTLPEIQARCGGSEASCSARLRDLRKGKFGGYQVDRRYRAAGVWEYRVVR